MNVFEIDYIQLLNKCFDLTPPPPPQLFPSHQINVELSRLKFVLLNIFLDLIELTVFMLINLHLYMPWFNFGTLSWISWAK